MSCELELVLHPQSAHLPAGQRAQELEALLTSLTNGYNGCTNTPYACGWLCLSQRDAALRIRVSGQVTPAPAIQVDGSGDFGLLALGEKASRSIEIRNVGDIGSVLEGTVELVGAGPMRIAPGTRDYRLSPGQAHTIVLEAETTRWGSFTQELIVRSNTPGDAEKHINLHAESIKADVWLNLFIPWPEVAVRNPSGPAGTPVWCVTGDDRGFSDTLTSQGPPSFRTHVLVTMDIANEQLVEEPRPVAGISHEIECGTADAESRYLSDLLRGGPRRVPPPTTHVLRSGQADASCMQVELVRSTPWVQEIRIVVDCTIPVGPWIAPAINAGFLIHIDPNSRSVQVTGRHDGFPAYEIYAWFTGQPKPATVYRFAPRNRDETLALLPPMDIVLPPIDVSPHFFDIDTPSPRERTPR